MLENSGVEQDAGRDRHARHSESWSSRPMGKGAFDWNASGLFRPVLREPSFVLVSKYDRSHILWLCLIPSIQGHEEGSV